MALPVAFLEELRARTPLPALIGRRVKLARSGRQWKGCCPFHGEKTPSFYVYDDHFHCFGCGAHGDAITFTMQTAGGDFMDAVAQLAAEAGLDVPQPSPEAARREQQRLDLHGVLDAAQASFIRRLREPEGKQALDYLHGRGLTDTTIAAFGLGWSGDGRGALLAELAALGVDVAQLREAGLLRATEEGGRGRELFFNRVTFPIRDRRARLISFGGRALGDQKPKYLNGPETALFSKRRNLYALDQARHGLRGGAALVVVEGYMDVIALHQAGFTGAVAPLGTALTEDQLDELWRMASLPVICFDGDAAGRRAALRALNVALPLLTPDRSLRLALLPDAEDPDSLVRRGGPVRFQAVLDGAKPLSQALFDGLREGVSTATPEARAQLLARLMEAAGRIADRSLAGEYRQDLRTRFYALRGRTNGRTPPSLPPARTAPDGGTAMLQRLRLLTVILLRHPDLIADVEEAFCRLELPPGLHRLRSALIDRADQAHRDGGPLDSAGLIDHLHHVGLSAEVEQVLSAVAVGLPECARDTAMPAEAEAGWWHFFGLMHPDRLETEIQDARRAFTDRPDEEAQRRLIALCHARDALRRGEHGAEQEPQ